MRGQALLAAGVMAMAVSFAGSANAQSYQGSPAYGAPVPGYGASAPGYDPNCKQRKTSNGVIGALVGATAGVLIGGSTYNGGHREDGRLIGGVLGAGAGAAIGAGGTNCSVNTAAYPTQAAPPPAPPPQDYGRNDRRDDELLGGPNDRYGDRDYGRNDGYADDGYAPPPPRRYAAAPRQCRLADQWVRDRYGRPYRASVEICRDPYSGEWVVRR